MTNKEFRKWINESGSSRNEAIQFIVFLHADGKLDNVQLYHLMIEIFKAFDY